MSIPELEWLAEHARTHTRIVEVGCWMGRSTRALADNTPGLVYAVDFWPREPEAFQRFGQNLVDLLNKKVFVVHMPSIDAANLFIAAKQKVDMVFIDGNHDYEYVSEDIRLWRQVLEPGGLLCGHDYADPGTVDYTPSVNRAVDEQVPDVQVLRGVAEGTTYDTCRIWWKVL